MLQRSLSVVLAVLFGTGCATYPGHATYPDSHSYYPGVENVLVVSDPPGAVVTAGAQKVTTPGALSLDPARDHELIVAKDGYVSKKIPLDSKSGRLSAVGEGVRLTLAVALIVGLVMLSGMASANDCDPPLFYPTFYPASETTDTMQPGETRIGLYELTLNPQHSRTQHSGSDDIVFEPSAMSAKVVESPQAGRADAETWTVEVNYWGYKLEVRLKPVQRSGASPATPRKPPSNPEVSGAVP